MTTARVPSMHLGVKKLPRVILEMLEFEAPVTEVWPPNITLVFFLSHLKGSRAQKDMHARSSSAL